MAVEEKRFKPIVVHDANRTDVKSSGVRNDILSLRVPSNDSNHTTSVKKIE